ncbi:hypothetical protein [Prescottella equi]
MEWPSVDVHTGPGIVVATATPSEVMLAAWSGWTLLPGAGGWVVP